MMLPRPSFRWLLIASLALSMAAASGCVGTQADGDAAGNTLELGETEQALNDSPDPNEGKVCYVDGPKERKGKMESGYCCYDTEDGNACVWCDKKNQCTPGGDNGPVVSLTTTGWWTPPKTTPKVPVAKPGTVSRAP